MADPVAFYKAGDTVEGLRILQELGQGAASTVYLAQDPKTKQIWALKHVHRSTEKDDRFLEQAVGEYEVASKLDHEAIRKIPRIYKTRAKLFTLLTDVILVMEFTDGVSMDKRRPRTYEEAVEIFHQVASAMKHMHERGFVHADMKPNNVMVSPGPVAKIIDLGQSCGINALKERIQGTPDYMAPEQSVKNQPITPLTDIYNLGATMYWVLTKRAVPTAMNQSTENSLLGKMDVSMIPKPPAVGELDPNCHPKLNELIMHCVELDPNDRPESMGYVCDRLQLILGMLRASRGKAGGTAQTALLDPGASRADSAGTKAGANAGSGAGVKPDPKSASTSVLGVRVPDSKN
jgi:serine/threonine-protein kinase